MRILLASSHGTDPAYGGAERYARDIAAGMSGRGHDVTVLTAFPQRSAVAGLETLTLHGSDWRDSAVRRIGNHVGDLVTAPWPRLGTILEELAPDLLHTGNLFGIGTGIWELARRAAVPCVHTLHDYWLLCPRTSLVRRDGTPCSPSPLLCGARTRRLARWSGGVNRLIAGSEHLLGMHAQLFPEALARVIRLPLAPLEAGPGPAPAGLRTLGYIGALTPTKGVPELLAAVGALAASGVRVRIAGEGPLRDAVAAADVEFAGRLEGAALERFTLGCDAGIVPSTWEEPSGPPYTVCEWLAAGRPVLASRRGGLAEAESLGGVVGLEPTAAGIAGAVAALAEPGAWQRTVAAVPAIGDEADVERWLDEHEAVYGAAAAVAASRT